MSIVPTQYFRATTPLAGTPTKRNVKVQPGQLWYVTTGGGGAAPSPVSVWDGNAWVPLPGPSTP